LKGEEAPTPYERLSIWSKDEVEKERKVSELEEPEIVQQNIGKIEKLKGLTHTFFTGPL